MALFFYLFSFLLILGSLGVVFTRNPVNAVLCLIFTFCQAAGIFLLLGAEFIAMTIIIVYVGAVSVLFLFTVMMLDIQINNIKKYTKVQIFLNIILCIGLVTDATIIIKMAFTGYKFQNNSIFLIPNSQITNTHAIGKILYTDFFLAFQTSGFILFLAMIGCVALTLRPNNNKRKELLLDYYETRIVTMANPKIGEGIKDE
jgi:NADH-quinone oxidoreductase subunit J